MHPYENISLFTSGLLLAIWLIGTHLLMLLKPVATRSFLTKFPRNQIAGQILLAVGLVWFWLLVAPESMGKLSALAMDLGEFNKAKWLLRILVPVALVSVVISVKDFLAVRALGVVGLMVASPLLESAFLKDPGSRLLVPIYAYALLTASMFWVGMPYLFRDAVTWATANTKRWNLLAIIGLGYGVATLVCAFAFWRAY
ncbi:MAG: hypothetical protein K9N23_12490 [Akkermansiaceae bacterium]|nr:hypothetical protein [Akkermansiaceae bacterium]MCF7732501.1 hypothetical protein [Akkermansiaceae bacterium]